MRLKRNRRIQIYHHPLKVGKDNEGGPNKSYGTGKGLYAIVWPAASKLQIAQYGNEINRIQNIKLEGKYTVTYDEGLGTEVYRIGDVLLKENDGIRLYEEEKPDYYIISIKTYKNLMLEVKKL